MKKNFLNFIKKLIKKQNFTPGPASLLVENLDGLRPCFGREDFNYDKIEKRVLNKILKISGHKKIARLQGAASLAFRDNDIKFFVWKNFNYKY